MIALKDWLYQTRTRKEDLAHRLGLTYSGLNKIVTGERLPSLETAVKIEQITRGKVKPKDFIQPTCPRAETDEPRA